MLTTYSTHVGEYYRTRYFKCNVCGCDESKGQMAIPIEYAPKQAARRDLSTYRRNLKRR